MNLYFFKPFSFNKNLGKAYNDCMKLVPNDEDWGFLMDGDVAFLDNEYGNIIKQHIDKFDDGEVGQFGCFASRTGNKYLRPEGIYNPNQYDIVEQKKKYNQVKEKYGISTKQIPNHVTGFFIGIKKKVWKEIPAPETDNKLAGVDVRWSQAIKQQGYKLLCMQGLYVLHYYRAAEGGVKYTEHLK